MSRWCRSSSTTSLFTDKCGELEGRNVYDALNNEWTVYSNECNMKRFFQLGLPNIFVYFNKPPRQKI